jgi:hypothetical protein
MLGMKDDSSLNTSSTCDVKRTSTNLPLSDLFLIGHKLYELPPLIYLELKKLNDFKGKNWYNFVSI